MKQLSQPVWRSILFAGLLGLLALTSATAQRTDTLSARTVDVIDPNNFGGMAIMNGFMYYLADDGRTGYELWRSNGTPAGTNLVKDIRPGRASAFVSDSSFYYFGRDYVTTTYTFSAQRVKNALRAFRPFVHTATNTLYFWADNGTNGIELWKSNGTDAGTQMVSDLIAGPMSSGSQFDILSDGYFGGTNGGSENYQAYYSPTFTTKGNKLLFWTSNIRDYVFETDGTAAGTRDMNFQTTKYMVANRYPPIVVDGRTYIQTYFNNKGKWNYSLVQDNGQSVTPLISSVEGYINVLGATRQGLWYAVEGGDAKQYTYTVFRRDSATAKVTALKTITIAKPATGTRYQYVYGIGQTSGSLWLRAYDEIPYQQSGKNSNELWRVDLATDSVQRVQRFESTVAFANNVNRYEKGSESFNNWIQTPNGMLFITAAADSTSANYNRYAVHTYNAQTNKLQALEEGMNYFSWRQLTPDGKRPGLGGKVMFTSRKTPIGVTQLWMTDGRTKQVIKNLNTNEFGGNITTVDDKLYLVGYVGNKDSKKQNVHYKVDVWRLDSTAAGTTQIGQANGFPYGVGTLMANGNDLYGSNGSFLIRLSSPAPDSIRFVADVNNFADISRDGNFFGYLNGKIIARATNGPLIAVDPKATPRRCLIAYESRTRASTNFNTKDLGYCPTKDSVVTLRERLVGYGSGAGEISRIYYKNKTWLRDSTALQSGTSDSLKLRQQGQYALTLRGTADGCTASDTWQVYYSNPTVSQIPKLSNTDGRRELVAVVTGGYPINGGSGYYSGTWERTAADGGISQASAATSFNAASGVRYPATAWLDEVANNVATPRYGTYTLKVTDANSCSATGTYLYDDKAVVLNVAATLGARNGAELCAGTPVSYTAAVSGGKAPYTYRWLRNGAPVAALPAAIGTYALNNDMLTTDYSGNFSIEATDADGKKTYSKENLYFIKASPIVSITATGSTVSPTQSVVLTANCSNYQYPTFAWAKDGATVTGVASRTLAATSAGLYSVTIGSGTPLGCTAQTSLRIGTGSGRKAAETAVVTTLSSADRNVAASPAGIELSKPARPERFIAEERKPELRVRPNPTEGPTQIEMELPTPARTRGRVLGPQGNIIEQWNDPQAEPRLNRQIDLTTQPPGLYIIQTEADGQLQTRKIIKK
ncbi:hypothetical protein [Spirosoma montaniterrae]|nr:hypothetical protein [Spirosoma montaniterrae]